jgi:hypothetical protein
MWEKDETWPLLNIMQENYKVTDEIENSGMKYF